MITLNSFAHELVVMCMRQTLPVMMTVFPLPSGRQGGGEAITRTPITAPNHGGDAAGKS